jgi:aminocarboxymuconate-semialdehyde decarboxylase
MYYDDLVYDGPTLHRLIEVFGDTQLMAGTDYPFTIMDPDPAGRLDALGLPPNALKRLRSDNARRWLGLAD